MLLLEMNDDVSVILSTYSNTNFKNKHLCQLCIYLPTELKCCTKGRQRNLITHVSLKYYY